MAKRLTDSDSFLSITELQKLEIMFVIKEL